MADKEDVEDLFEIEIEEDEEAGSEEDSAEEIDNSEEEDESDGDDEGESDETDSGSEEEPEEKGLSEEEKEKYGKRAQKRIQTLVRQRKEAEERAAETERKLQELNSKVSDLESTRRKSEEQQLVRHGEHLKLLKEAAKRDFIAAEDSGDVEKKLEASERMARIAQEEVLIERAKQNFSARSVEDETPKRQEKRPEPKAEETVEKSQVDKDALKWWRRNTWFNDTSKPINILMTEHAREVHNQLLEEGVDPATDSEEYYAELDKRIAAEFPDEVQPQREKKKRPAVLGGSRSTQKTGKGKKVVKLTRSEKATCDRLGISYQEYAREKVRKESSNKGWIEV